ncbi:MAG: radical SAM protein, partial [Clostridiales bacterium]|nr:radical SAM protein [Clostridiales bacterium]
MSALDIRSASLAELEGLMREIGEPSYRASQVFSWIHKRYVNSFAEMTDLSLNLRQRLGERGRFSPVEMAGRSASKADDATKYLFALENNTIIESVFMRHGHGATVCVSTQAGCRMGCKFCASASEGLQRNLSAGEMCAQVYGAARDAGERRVSNVVLMGCGEPLDNYGASLRFIHLLCDARGFGLSQRSVTLSTCGLVPRIYALAEERLP